MRPHSTDFSVAAESLGTEYDVPLSYFSKDYSGVIIDAGGYIGTSAIKFSRACPNATVYTIEPSPANFAVLVENTRPYPNIVPVHAALAMTTGTVPLRDRGTGHWGFTIVDRPADVADAVPVAQVTTTTLSELAITHGFSAIGLLKIDIEGAEFDLLMEAESWIDKVEMLVVELHERIRPGVEELFKQKTQGRINLDLAGEKTLSICRTRAAGGLGNS